MSDDTRTTAQTFREGFNCSQAVLSTHAERLGLPRKVALKLAEGFGGGMAGLGETCGAVTGAMMVIGLTEGRTEADDLESKSATASKVRRFVSQFEARHGSITCRELLGCSIDTPQGLEAARDHGLFTTVCSRLVESAAELLEEQLGDTAT